MPMRWLRGATRGALAMGGGPEGRWMHDVVPSGWRGEKVWQGCVDLAMRAHKCTREHVLLGSAHTGAAAPGRLSDGQDGGQGLSHDGTNRPDGQLATCYGYMLGPPLA